MSSMVNFWKFRYQKANRVIEEMTIATDDRTKCVAEATRLHESEVLLSDSKASKLKKEYEDIAEKEIKSTNANLKESVDPLKKQLESNAAEGNANGFAKKIRDEGIEIAKADFHLARDAAIDTVKVLKKIQEDEYALIIATHKQNCASAEALLNDEAVTVDTINSKLEMLELIKPQDLTAPDMTDFDADTTTPDMTQGVGYGANTTPSGGVEGSDNFITSMRQAMGI